MKSGRRVKKTITPKDLAALFREWQELRIRVSEAELAAARSGASYRNKDRRKCAQTSKDRRSRPDALTLNLWADFLSVDPCEP